MTNEQAKSELEQLYMSLSEEKKKALDVAFKAMEQADNIPVMYYPQVEGITPTVVAQADGEKVFKMRDATPEEQEAVDKYIKSISKPTGVNIFDFYEDEDKSCDNCKHHLKFMCKKWETCHNYSDWELEELDFVQPHKTIPCKIKVADGEYILKKDVMGCIGQTSLHWELARKLRKLPSVAIPSAEPKIVPIAEIKFDDDMLHELVEEAVKNIEIEPKWIPVSERLPEENTAVLIWCPERRNIYCAYLEEKQWWIFGAYFQKVALEVIAWMPLPAPYEPQESEEV